MDTRKYPKRHLGAIIDRKNTEITTLRRKVLILQDCLKVASEHMFPDVYTQALNPSVGLPDAHL